MKKAFCLAITILLMISCLIGCENNNNEESINSKLEVSSNVISEINTKPEGQTSEKQDNNAQAAKEEETKEKTEKEKAEKAAAEKAAKEKAAKEQAAKEKAAKEKAEKDAKEKAAKEQAIKDAKNPKKSLKVGSSYNCITVLNNGHLVKTMITFDSATECSYSYIAYSTEESGNDNSISYNGKKYYEAGSDGNPVPYRITEKEVVLYTSQTTIEHGYPDGELHFELDENSNLIVKSVKGTLECVSISVKAGDKFTKQ